MLTGQNSQGLRQALHRNKSGDAQSKPCTALLPAGVTVASLPYSLASCTLKKCRSKGCFLF